MFEKKNNNEKLKTVFAYPEYLLKYLDLDSFLWKDVTFDCSLIDSLITLFSLYIYFYSYSIFYIVFFKKRKKKHETNNRCLRWFVEFFVKVEICEFEKLFSRVHLYDFFCFVLIERWKWRLPRSIRNCYEANERKTHTK